MMIKLIILDRDGVINYDSKDYIKSPDEWRPIPGSLEAIAKLNAAGYKVAIATNQSGVGRGYYSLKTLEQIHQKLVKALKAVNGHIDALSFCPHTPSDHCACRKPRAGLLLDIANKLEIDLSNAVMIGDSKRDLEAAFLVGAQGIYIHPELKEDIPYVPVYGNLADAVDAILEKPDKKFGQFPIMDFQDNRFKEIRKNNLLLKAVGMKKKDFPDVLDLTAGFGRDACMLYLAGCKVQLVERSWLVAHRLKALLAQESCHVPLFIGEAKVYLEQLKYTGQFPSVIYFDPIFPEKNKSALSQKAALMLKAIVGEDNDAVDVFQLALTVAKKRVVVKRPLHAKTITDQKPDIVFKGRSIRFDVYLVSI